MKALNCPYKDYEPCGYAQELVDKLKQRAVQIADLKHRLENMKADRNDLEAQVQKLLAKGAKF